jgi:hypothetical protein
MENINSAQTLPINIPSVEEYKDMLARHDWFYNHSDSHSIWQAGDRERARLIKLAYTSPEYRSAWNFQIARVRR